MRGQNRITVLLGAGAMMDVTTLSCYSITQNVIAKRQNIFRDGKWESVPFLNYVYEQLREYYSKERESVNFEDIFHALEMLSSIQTANDEQTVKSFRSVFGMLCNVKEEFRDLKISPKYLGYMAKTQAAEHVYQYPIVTGLRKNDKIMTPPFDAYYTHLYQQLRNNKNLLIIGYGFGDLYINGLLNQFRSFHGTDGKVICIGYLNSQNRVQTMADMPISNSMKQSIYMLFDDPELSYQFLDFEHCMKHLEAALEDAFIAS